MYAGKAGWQGEDCSTVDQQVYQCLPGCSERGTYDLETGTCICDRHWTGPDCSQGRCFYFIFDFFGNFSLVATLTRSGYQINNASFSGLKSDWSAL